VVQHLLAARKDIQQSLRAALLDVLVLLFGQFREPLVTGHLLLQRRNDGIDDHPWSFLKLSAPV
jgi:hypothetical protein